MTSFETWSKTRLIPFVAWGTLFVILGTYLAGWIIQRESGWPIDPAEQAVAFAFLGLSAVGAFITARRSGSTVGWILLLAPAGAILGFSAFEYARFSLLTQPNTLPFGETALWLWLWVDDLSVGVLVTFLIQWFPTGRPVTPGWRPLTFLTAGLLVLVVLSAALAPGPIEGFEPYTNPLGIGGAAELIQDLLDLTLLLVAPIVFFSALSLVIRFRRSRGEERAQLKWFLYATGLLALSILYAVMSEDFGVVPLLPGNLSTVLFAVNVGLISTAIAIAVLKYRLYDIDLIIRRTLIYGVLTASLALTYFGSVALTQRFTPARSQADIVVSTLAIAALFQPLRNRIQKAIDRRFYRQRYDADRILADFAGDLRDEVDPERLANTLLSAVARTVQPTHLSFWLRERREDRPAVQA